MAKQKSLRVGVISFSGNVGKSTMSAYLLAPRMPDARIMSIESINEDEGVDAEVLIGKQFERVQEELLTSDSVIVDVGASNVEEFMKRMQQFRGSHEDFDMFLIPTVKETKQIRDTITTINALRAMGVPASKLRVVFNKVDVEDVLERDFAPLFSYHAAESAFALNTKAVVYASELYPRLRMYNTTPTDLVKDDTDWRAKLREARTANDEEAMLDAVDQISMRRLATSVQENLDAVFSALTSSK